MAESHLLYEVNNSVGTITINRPSRKNALTPEMYIRIAVLLHAADNDDNVKLVVLTGAGDDFFSSGNDLFMSAINIDDIDRHRFVSTSYVLMYFFSFVEFSKPLIACVNGPAIGAACTILPYFDFVVCSDKAYFSTPFSKLALCAEGGSSLTFPRILGPILARKMLLEDYTLSAAEALQHNFVCDVYPANTFREQCAHRIESICERPKESLRTSVSLVRLTQRDAILAAMVKEGFSLINRFGSNENLEALMKFIGRKQSVAKL